MPHAALWVVQPAPSAAFVMGVLVSMPHAALWVVQLRERFFMHSLIMVSMPHAALWVVQHQIVNVGGLLLGSFNAARGFVGGAAKL